MAEDFTPLPLIPFIAVINLFLVREKKSIGGYTYIKNWLNA